MNISNYINDYLTRNIVVKSVPESLLKYQEDLMIAYFRGSAEEYGMKLEEYLANLGIAGIDALLEMSLEENKKNAESFLIYQAIIEDSGIKVTEEDISEYFKENLGTEDYSVYEERFGLPYLKLTVLSDLVMDYLYDNVVLQ